jgi:hypothetical protein
MFEIKGMKDFPHCQWCGWSFYVYLHHNTPTKKRQYTSWKEESEDIIVLCRGCHLDAHNGNWKNLPNKKKFRTKKRVELTPHLLYLMKHRDKLIETRLTIMRMARQNSTTELYDTRNTLRDMIREMNNHIKELIETK